MVELPFLKKKKPEVIKGKGFTPTERVREMASRGFSEPEMIDILRREGFSPEEIDLALTQALKTDVAGKKEEEKPSTSLPTLEELTPKQEAMPQMPETSLPEEYYQQTYPTEDYIDYIVQSRVQDVYDKMREFSIKYQELEKRMAAISDQLNELVKTRRGAQQEIINRIDNFNETVNDVSSRVGSLEKAMKETLPALIESVRALSDIVQRMKRES